MEGTVVVWKRVLLALLLGRLARGSSPAAGTQRKNEECYHQHPCIKDARQYSPPHLLYLLWLRPSQQEA